MTSGTSTSVRRMVSLHILSWQASGDAFLLPVSTFPIPEQEFLGVQRFLARLTASLVNERSLSSEVFLQLFQLKEGRRRLTEYSRQWMPELGLGVWPDRPPPTLWRKDEFLNLSPGEELRPLMYQVVRITASAIAREMARGLLLDVGSIIHIMLPEKDETFLARASEFLLATIHHPSLQHARFYMPLLERKSLTSADRKQLDAWLCGATVYIRESFEDKGIIIASREPLTPMMEKLGGRYEEKPGPHWEIPV